MRISVFAVLLTLAMAASAAQWYEPAQAGHGLTVEAVGDQYLATWVTHDGRNARWITSDLCVWGEACPVWTVAARSFPAVAARLVEAGTITLIPAGDGSLLMEYDLDIPGVACSGLPGPLPPECRGEDGRTAAPWWWVEPLEAAGDLSLELLIE